MANPDAHALTCAAGRPGAARPPSIRARLDPGVSAIDQLADGHRLCARPPPPRQDLQTSAQPAVAPVGAVTPGRSDLSHQERPAGSRPGAPSIEVTHSPTRQSHSPTSYQFTKPLSWALLLTFPPAAANPPRPPGLMASARSACQPGPGSPRPAASEGIFSLGRFTRPKARAFRLPHPPVGQRAWRVSAVPRPGLETPSGKAHPLWRRWEWLPIQSEAVTRLP